MKKIYIKPTTTVTYLDTVPFMAGSAPTAVVDDGKGPTGTITKTTEGDDDESDAKGNAWSNWED